ncbi:hypothetical protein [Uliginosibacterium sediminicola]|uniref:Uncharacterized protein n=1 Tax=Uliginosibacterium sediminicola TaxID=2024550 RepID=A0ABU9Z105_9RHOO
MKTVTLVFIILFSNITYALTQEEAWAIHSTPLGTLEFKYGEKLSRTNFDGVYLDGIKIYSVIGRKDVWDTPISLSEAAVDIVRSNGKVVRDERGRARIKRLLLSESGMCIHEYVIIDLTGKSPFVSNRFGHNPTGKSCFELISTKWGAKKSYITIFGPLKYMYTTGEDVIGPVE